MAPRTRAKPNSAGTTPARLKDMISSTSATLEWASQARTAAKITAKIGSLDRGAMMLCRASLPRRGSEAPTMSPSDSSNRPSPIDIRPM